MRGRAQVLLLLALPVCSGLTPQPFYPASRPCRGAVPRHPHSVLCAEGGGDGLNMDLLAKRIKQVTEAPQLASVRLFVLDAMVPGQRLAFIAPSQLVEALRKPEPLVMFGIDPAQRRQCTHGVGISLESAEEQDDGDFDVTIKAEGLCQLVDDLEGEEQGSRWAGRMASVRWLSLDTPDDSMTDDLMSRSAALERLVDEWANLVRRGRERSPGQLDGVIRDLGPIPDADAPSQRALWIAGLINPLPALGVALEIRPAALMAPTAELRVQVVEAGIKDSIQRLKSPGPAF